MGAVRAAEKAQRGHCWACAVGVKATLQLQWQMLDVVGHAHTGSDLQAGQHAG